MCIRVAILFCFNLFTISSSVYSNIIFNTQYSYAQNGCTLFGAPCHSACTSVAILVCLHLLTILRSVYSNIICSQLVQDVAKHAYYAQNGCDFFRAPAILSTLGLPFFSTFICGHFHLVYTLIVFFTISTRPVIPYLLHSEWLQTLQSPSHSECTGVAILLCVKLWPFSSSVYSKLFFSQLVQGL